jgi:hypothetical protein
MAPSFRRGFSSSQTTPVDSEENQVLTNEEGIARSPSVWDRRRRRLEKKRSEAEPDQDFSEKKALRRRSRQLDDNNDVDPYDSDPGESYREHCLRLNGLGSRSCMTLPTFLKNHRKVETDTVLTAPPSPLASEGGDLYGPVPASLPANLTRVRYSLRSSITDGSEKQPTGPSVMERRELRPNHVHVNVSHWSDAGARPYMEDRYVTIHLLTLFVHADSH